MSQTVYVGACRVRVEVDGCVDCGTKISSVWHRAQAIPVYIAQHLRTLILLRCAACQGAAIVAADDAAQAEGVARVLAQ